MENKNSFEQAFKPLLTNSEIKKMEHYKQELGSDFKDVYWSLSIPDIELIVKDFRKKYVVDYKHKPIPQAEKQNENYLIQYKDN